MSDMSTGGSRLLKIWRSMWHLRLLWLLLAGTALAVWLLQPLVGAAKLPAPALPPFTPEPPALQETVMTGPSTLAPGTQAAIRILVRDPTTQTPISDATVRLSMAFPQRPDAGRVLFSGTTDDLGSVEAAFAVPDEVDGARVLVVDTSGPVGEQRIVHPVAVRRNVDLHLMSDKESYRPGDEMHAWLVALEPVSGLPAAGEQVELRLYDTRGNDVCSANGTTSEQGVVEAACVLASQAMTGTYRFMALVGEAGKEQMLAELEVPVISGSANDLRLQIEPDRPFYLSGERVQGVVRVLDLAGIPAPAADVRITGRIKDQVVIRVAGKADAEGHYVFATTPVVPGDGGMPVEMHVAAEAVDSFGHSGRVATTLTVAQQAIQVTITPERVPFEPGFENIIAIQTTYPDGQAALCDLRVNVSGVPNAFELESDADGVARIAFTPVGPTVTVEVQARDEAGYETRVRREWPVSTGDPGLLIQTEDKVFRAGEPIHVDVQASNEISTVYLDVLVSGQPVATYAAATQEGSAMFDVTLDAHKTGMIELNAYAWTAEGSVIRDVWLIEITSGHRMQISMNPDRITYAPSDTARVALCLENKADRQRAGVAFASALLPDHSIESGEHDIVLATRTVPASEMNLAYANVVSKRRPLPERVREQFNTYERNWRVRRGAFSVAIERIAWALIGCVAVVCVLAVLGIGAGMPAGTAAGRIAIHVVVGVVVVPAIAVGAVIVIYLAQLVFGPGAALALCLAWIGCLSSLFVHGDRWTVALGQILVLLLALGIGLWYGMVRGGTLDLLVIQIGLAALAVGALALYVYGARLVQVGSQQAGWAAIVAVALLACTLAGILLMPRNPNIPVQQVLPEQMPADAAPDVPQPQPSEPSMARFVEPGARWPVAVGRAGETLYWQSQIPMGEADCDMLDIPLVGQVDDIELAVWGLSQEGAQGSARIELDLDQPLVVDVDLPLELTVGDELVVPVVFRNARSVSQTVQITVTPSSWFRIYQRGAELQTLQIPPLGQVEASVPIRVREYGERVFDLAYQGSGRARVISRAVHVRPNAKWIARAYSWWIDDWVRYKFRVPWSAISGTDQVAVGLYPGPESVLSASFDAALERKGTSLDEVAAAIETRWLYAEMLRQWGGGSDTLQMAWMRRLVLDYQHLVTFETDEGGFSAFGDPPADLYRSALALRCLGELVEAGVADERTLDRVALWLMRQQSIEATWQLSRMPPSWSTLSRPALPVTAYVAWSLIEAGYADTVEVRSAIEYLELYTEAEDPYVLALVANALVAYDNESDAAEAALMRLVEQVEVIEGLAFWPSRLQTLSGAVGGPVEIVGYRMPSLHIESTALAVRALSRSGSYPDLVSAGIKMLTDSRGVQGAWTASTATAMALRALLSSSFALQGKTEIGSSATVTVTVDGIAAPPAAVKGNEARVLVFEELSKGYNDVEIDVEGEEIGYQIVGSYYLPWSQVPPLSAEEEVFSLEIGYDRTAVKVGEWITATVRIALNRADPASLVMLQLGLPPGLEVRTADLDALLDSGAIAHYEQTDGTLMVYLCDLSTEELVQFSYSLRAKYPVAVWTQPTVAIDIANPQQPTVREPVEIVVSNGEAR